MRKSSRNFPSLYRSTRVEAFGSTANACGAHARSGTTNGYAVFTRPWDSTYVVPQSVGCPSVSGFHFMFRRSEEHTSELQSRENLVCRLLLEKKKKLITNMDQRHHRRRYRRATQSY